jgi:hypothetical protein
MKLNFPNYLATDSMVHGLVKQIMHLDLSFDAKDLIKNLSREERTYVFDILNLQMMRQLLWPAHVLQASLA